jgi:hypothetical protein
LLLLVRYLPSHQHTYNVSLWHIRLKLTATEMQK